MKSAAALNEHSFYLFAQLRRQSFLSVNSPLATITELEVLPVQIQHVQVVIFHFERSHKHIYYSKPAPLKFSTCKARDAARVVWFSQNHHFEVNTWDLCFLPHLPFSQSIACCTPQLHSARHSKWFSWLSKVSQTDAMAWVYELPLKHMLLQWVKLFFPSPF